MTKVSDFYEDYEDFISDLEAAEENAETDRARKFLEELRERAEEYEEDTFLSEAQHTWLMQLVRNTGRFS